MSDTDPVDHPTEAARQRDLAHDLLDGAGEVSSRQARTLGALATAHAALAVAHGVADLAAAIRDGLVTRTSGHYAVELSDETPPSDAPTEPPADGARLVVTRNPEADRVGADGRRHWTGTAEFGDPQPEGWRLDVAGWLQRKETSQATADLWGALLPGHRIRVHQIAPRLAVALSAQRAAHVVADPQAPESPEPTHGVRTVDEYRACHGLPPLDEPTPSGPSSPDAAAERLAWDLAGWVHAHSGSAARDLRAVLDDRARLLAERDEAREHLKALHRSRDAEVLGLTAKLDAAITRERTTYSTLETTEAARGSLLTALERERAERAAERVPQGLTARRLDAGLAVARATGNAQSRHLDTLAASAPDLHAALNHLHDLHLAPCMDGHVIPADPEPLEPEPQPQRLPHTALDDERIRTGRAVVEYLSARPVTLSPAGWEALRRAQAAHGIEPRPAWNGRIAR